MKTNIKDTPNYFYSFFSPQNWTLMLDPNRRIGELFKEIDLSEKQGTGIPKILRELKQNGSPEPEFEMDEKRTYLNIIIPIHNGFKMSDKTSDKMSDKDKMFYTLLLQAFENSNHVTTKMMTDLTGLADSTTRRYLNKFYDWNIIKSDGKIKQQNIIWYNHRKIIYMNLRYSIIRMTEIFFL